MSTNKLAKQANSAIRQRLQEGKFSSHKVRREKKENYTMSTKVLVVFVLCLIAVCYASTSTVATKAMTTVVGNNQGMVGNNQGTSVSTAPSSSMPVMSSSYASKQNNTGTGAGFRLTAPVVLIVSALALFC